MKGKAMVDRRGFLGLAAFCDVDCCLDGGKARSDFGWTTKLTDWLLLGRKAIDNPGQEVRMG